MTDAFDAKAQEITEWIKRDIAPQRVPGHLQIMIPERIAEALRQAETGGYLRGLEDAAKESEQWWNLFQNQETCRFANPNQIAARIRALSKEGK